jgi:hypothetical protein
VFEGHSSDPKAAATLGYLLQHKPDSLDDPYVLALVANALAAIDPQQGQAEGYVNRLEALKRTRQVGQAFQPDGNQAFQPGAGRASRADVGGANVRLESLTYHAWWEQGPTDRTMFYGAGRSASVETTALACLAMLATGRHPATVRSALAWLVEQKDPSGTWHSTQATVLALKALLAGTGKPLAEGRARRIEIRLDGKVARTLAIAPEDSEVVQLVDLSPLATRGKHQLLLSDLSGSAVGYRAALWFHVPERQEAARKEPLAIKMSYDKTALSVQDVVNATATVENHMRETAPMVILDLPIPAGFAVEGDDFARMVEAGTIARYQVTASSAIVYLRELTPAKPLVLRYHLRATMPVRVAVPPARAYEYYNPDNRTASGSSQFIVAARP